MRAFEPGQMLSTLRALAARQGRTVDPGSEEEPGKILHEVRLTERPWLGEGTASGVRPYYGSIDATPLFLMLLGEAWRWGCDRSGLAALLPAARAALRWMRGHGDPDGDGLLEYAPRGPRSLANQAWKDSVDAVQHPDGTLAEGPIAMVEVQGYATTRRRPTSSPRPRGWPTWCAGATGSPAPTARPVSSPWRSTDTSGRSRASPRTWGTCSGPTSPPWTRPARSRAI
jgi:hypothetical protein